MLRNLTLDGVGPTDHLQFGPLADRLNLIAGDNGLGKSFLLDLGWWALTRTWHGFPAVPHRPNAKIAYTFDGVVQPSSDLATWVPGQDLWKRKPGRPPNPGLVIYAGVDGSFSVWDPARNYRLYQLPDGSEVSAPASYRFSSEDVFRGLTDRRPGMSGTLCRGLLDDWVLWMAGGDPRFLLLKQILAALSPDPKQPIIPGGTTRPFPLADVREIPTIRTEYGQDVPITLAAAGTQRIVKLAYLLAWAFGEHEQVADPSSRATQMVIFIDEPETHLHPRWQRTVLPGLLAAMGAWRQDIAVQLIAATHSPLVLASAEPIFDPAHDALWKLDLDGGVVKLERDAWYRRGDANMWLISDVFDLEAPYSREAEVAMRDAETLMSRTNVTEPEMLAARTALRAALGDSDTFWLTWRAWVRQQGWKP